MKGAEYIEVCGSLDLGLREYLFDVYHIHGQMLLALSEVCRLAIKLVALNKPDTVLLVGGLRTYASADAVVAAYRLHDFVDAERQVSNGESIDLCAKVT